MSTKRLNILYLLFFVMAIFVFGVAIFEDQIRLRIRATSPQPSVQKSLMLVDKVVATVPKDAIQISVFARNESGDAIANVVINVQSTYGTIQPQSATTDTMGKAVFTLTADESGKSSISATVAGQKLPQVINVLFSE